MATFPADLSTAWDGMGFRPKIVPNTVETKNSIGPPSVRLRSSSQVIEYNTASLIVNATQYATFRAWWKNDIKFGSLPFDMTDPITDLTVSAQVIGGAYAPTPLGGDKWRIGIKLRIKDA